MTHRVLVLNHSAVPRGAAGITRHADLFSAVEGWEYLILAGDLNRFTDLRELDQPGFRSVKISAYQSNGLRRVLSWLQYAAKVVFVAHGTGKVDVVYASSPHLLTPLAGYIIAKFKRAGFVFEVRDLWPRILLDMGHLSETSIAYRVLSAVEARLYEAADRIIVMAPGVHEDLLNRGISKEKLSYIPNGGSSSDFIASAGRDELRERYGFAKFTAIYAGAHGPANGLHLLLTAAQAIQDVPISLVLVGGGVDKVSLQKRAHELNLTNVRFMEPVSKEEIPNLLHAADLGIHVLANVALFRTGVSPNKLFDYMAASLPVLTNSPGLCHDLVDSAECGFKTEPRRLDVGLRRAYLAYLDGKLNSLGLNGSNWIDANQSRHAMAIRLRDVLGDALRP